MTTKRERQERLRGLLSGNGAATQAELRAALRRDGVRVDQSTLSRDLSELGYRKLGGRYQPNEPHAPAVKLDLAPAVRGFLPCGPHLTVVRTELGQAQAVAVAIDAAGEPAIVSTLAGDDAIFVATRNRRAQVVALRRLAEWFGEKQER
jgi:transcriptional regulator of arginine metabolism